MVMNFPFAYGIRPYRILSCLFILFFYCRCAGVKKAVVFGFLDLRCWTSGALFTRRRGEIRIKEREKIRPCNGIFSEKSFE